MPTIKDVAKASGVSETTVSFVFNNSGSVGLQTRARILEIARQLQYSPSAVARGLQRKRMDTLGIIFPEGLESPITSPYYAAMVDSLFKAASRRGQHILFFAGYDNPDAPERVQIYRDGRCDGLLAFAQSRNSTLVEELQGFGVPLVLVNDTREDPDISYIDVDNFEAAKQMTAYLLDLGHSRIGFLGGDEVFNLVTQRRDGYRQALAEREIRYETALDIAGTFQPASVHERVHAMMGLPATMRPTAVVCCTDEMAISTLYALQEIELRVPIDVSVVGFNDAPVAATATPPLTTVRQPMFEIGERAVEILLAQILGEIPAGSKIILPTDLIIRKSAAPIY